MCTYCLISILFLDTSTCLTTDLKICKFPFEFLGRQHYDCPYYETTADFELDYDGVGSDTRWCPLSNEKDKKGYFKATGVCSESCSGSKADFYKTFLILKLYFFHHSL